VTVVATDVAVVGLGVIGLSAADELARRGRRVVGIDRLGSGHPATSSTGPTRSIRLAYAEPVYVGLASRALECWRQLERDEAGTVLVLTGQIDLGTPAKLGGLAEGMRSCGVAFEEIGAADVRVRFPELTLEHDERALFHADAGTVLAAAAMGMLTRRAIAAGAELSSPEMATRISVIDDTTVEVSTNRDRTIHAHDVVLAAGPWLGGLLSSLGLDIPLAPAVAQVTFLAAVQTDGRPGMAEWEIDEEGVGVYGHPVPGVGYKVAFDAGSRDAWRPEELSWEHDPSEAAALQRWLERRMPSLSTSVDRHQRHPWTMTSDGDFVIDRHGPLVIAGGCSGHAFKFGPALGELVADLIERHPRPELEHFSMDRRAIGVREARATMPISR
jgi:sarcosine oxidase